MAREYNRRCNFFDVTIYQRVNGRYINITDFSPFGNNETIKIDSESEYIVVYEGFLTISKSRTGEDIQFSELTEQKLITFAGFEKSSSKTMQGKLKVISDTAFTGILCAEVIRNTGFQKRIILKNNTAEIQCRKTVNGKQPYVPVLSLDIKHAKIQYIQ